MGINPAPILSRCVARTHFHPQVNSVADLSDTVKVVSSRPVPGQRVTGARLAHHPHCHGATHKNLVGKEKTRKKALRPAGCGTGRRDSGVRRVDDYLGTYETVGRIEKPDYSPGFRV
jgi:hypothetical protein